MVSQRELTRIIPADLISGCSQLLIECTHQGTIDIDVKFTEREAAFVNQAEGLPCEGECYCRSILGGFPVGTAIGFRGSHTLPARGVYKSAVLVVNGFGGGRRYRCIHDGWNDQRWSGQDHLCSSRRRGRCSTNERCQD